MKQSILFVVFITFLSATINKSYSQSCPVIVTNTFRITTDQVDPCLRKVQFDYYSPSNGTKRITVIIEVSNVVIIDDCVDATGNVGVTKTYISAAFTACNLANVKVTITPKTGNSCNVAGCSPTLFSIAGGTLPVTMYSFTASRSKEVVSLNWQTSTEINNKGFILERNSTGKWDEIAFVASKATNGNSTDLISYEYRDVNYNNGMTQYRIKQVDIDGNFKYSQVRLIQGTSQAGKTFVFPNPSNDGKVNLVFNGASTRNITVVDMAGRIVKQWSAFTSNSLQITDMLPGLYTVRTNDLSTGSISTEKFVIAAK